MLVNARRRLIRSEILGKSTGKAENFNVRKYNSVAICPNKN